MQQVNIWDGWGSKDLRAVDDAGYVYGVTWWPRAVTCSLKCCGDGKRVTEEASPSPAYLPVRRLLVAYGAPVAGLFAAGMVSEVTYRNYFTAVPPGAWSHRAAALAAWVYWHDVADCVPG